ncbi:acyltransferase [Microbacterium sp. NPDC058342]|uniref:acyltransferase n=1 Tax=Microbacterium sp. NPDC058342 TaxID=3346454 RepID=UPI0036670C8F
MTTRPGAGVVERADYLDRLRAIAIVGVVTLHAAALGMPEAPVSSPTWMTLNVYDGITRFCVPIFFMITGALLLDPRRRVSLSSILRKSLPRVAIAYILWSALYAGVAPSLGLGEPGMRAFLERWAVGHYHLWYLWALMGLYLATPLLRRIAADRVSATYFVVLAAGFGLVLPLLTPLPVVGQPLMLILDKMQFHVALGYSFYFMLGHLLHTGAADRLRTIWVAVAGVVGAGITVVGPAVASSRTGTAVLDLYEYLTPNVALFAGAVFLLVRRLGRRSPKTTRSSRVMRGLSDASFGIYLVHPLLQGVLAAAGVTTALLPAFASVPMMVLVLLVPSWMIAALLRRIPRFGRFIA